MFCTTSSDGNPWLSRLDSGFRPVGRPASVGRGFSFPIPASARGQHGCPATKHSRQMLIASHCFTSHLKYPIIVLKLLATRLDSGSWPLRKLKKDCLTRNRNARLLGLCLWSGICKHLALRESALKANASYLTRELTAHASTPDITVASTEPDTTTSRKARQHFSFRNPCHSKCHAAAMAAW